jgi:hypothetical protein
MEVRILKKGDSDEQPEAHGRFSLPEKERAQFRARPAQVLRTVRPS